MEEINFGSDLVIGNNKTNTVDIRERTNEDLGVKK